MSALPLKEDILFGGEKSPLEAPTGRRGFLRVPFGGT
jgi:hypothetical protein